MSAIESDRSAGKAVGAKTVSGRWSSELPEDRFDVYNPATGEVLASVQGGSAVEVDGAVRAAHVAWEENWRWLPPRERSAMLVDAARVLRVHADGIARLESDEIGKPLEQAALDVEFLIGLFEFFGGLANALPGQTSVRDPVLAVSTLEPYGVVGGIIPFNWPPIHAGGKAAPALAVGNTVVLKPPEQGPLTIMRIVELLQEVLPPDVLHVVPGAGPSTGHALAAHPLVAKMSFTGSAATGRAVLKTLAANVTPALMELGGKNALIVLEDVDIETAVGGILEGAYYNQGEACTAASRVLVHRSIYDELVERLGRAVSRLRVGDPMDASTDVGPLVTRAQQQRVLDYIRIGQEEGARVVAQAPLPEDERLRGGYWVAPTLFADVMPAMTIAREEIFGPVTCVMPFDEIAEAIRIANDSEYGLVAGVYTRDTSRALHIGRRISAGVIFVNNYNRALLGTPFGGTKQSGYGREHAMETLREFGYTKTFRLASGHGEIPRWSGVARCLRDGPGT
jgi:acyl-CoA reductase-like NAD-dependent aldehyde dehydrogenase